MPKKKDLKKTKAKKIATAKNIENLVKPEPKKLIPSGTINFWKNEVYVNRLISVVVAVLGISLFLGFNFYYLPEKILTQTDAEVQKQKNKEDETKKIQAKSDLDKLIAKEDSSLNFNQNKEWQVNFNFKDFGDLKINLKNEYAPKTVENFIRLVNRGYYSGTSIHRIVKTKDFAVIQGGDKEKNDGSGGKSAFYVDASNPGNIPDELWETKPTFTVEGEKNVLSNTPVFRSLDLYKNFDPDNGTVEYAKGQILMAKTSSPDSASSQFFITLDKTILPAQYTVFGTIDAESFAVLDKIMTEVSPVPTTSAADPNDPTAQPTLNTTDGKPDKSLLIQAKILKPEIK